MYRFFWIYSIDTLPGAAQAALLVLLVLLIGGGIKASRP